MRHWIGAGHVRNTPSLYNRLSKCALVILSLFFTSIALALRDTVANGYGKLLRGFSSTSTCKLKPPYCLALPPKLQCYAFTVASPSADCHSWMFRNIHHLRWTLFDVKDFFRHPMDSINWPANIKKDTFDFGETTGRWRSNKTALPKSSLSSPAFDFLSSDKSLSDDCAIASYT